MRLRHSVQVQRELAISDRLCFILGASDLILTKETKEALVYDTASFSL